MQQPEDKSGGESEHEAEADADAHVAGADGDEVHQGVKAGSGAYYDKQDVEAGSDAADDFEAGSDKENVEAGSSGDDDVEAGSDVDEDVEVASDADDDDVEAASDSDAEIQEEEDDARAVGTDNSDDDEEVDADPAGNRRANLVVAGSLLLAAVVAVTATIYAPPPPVTHSAHEQGLPSTFPTGDVTFSAVHNIPRGGTAYTNDNNNKWNGYHPSLGNFQVGVAPGDNTRPHSNALTGRFFSVVFTSVLHILYFWHQLGGLDLVLVPLVWVLMGVILYRG